MSTIRKFPPLGYYLALAVCLAGVVVTGFAGSVTSAVYVLAAVFGLHALARLGLPDGMVPRVRGRVLDSLLYLGFACLLVLLGEWGNTPLVVL